MPIVTVVSKKGWRWRSLLAHVPGQGGASDPSEDALALSHGDRGGRLLEEEVHVVDLEPAVADRHGPLGHEGALGQVPGPDSLVADPPSRVRLLASDVENVAVVSVELR